jgi:hypothetical protein
LSDFIPLRLLPPLILGPIVYYFVGLRSDSSAFFFKYLLILTMYNGTAAALCQALSALIADPATLNVTATTIILFEMLFGGLLVNNQSYPPYLSWLRHLSFFNCAFEALIVNEVNGLTLLEQKFGLSVDVPGALVLQAFGYDSQSFWTNTVRLIVMMTLFLCAGFLFLSLHVRKSNV